MDDNKREATSAREKQLDKSIYDVYKFRYIRF